jgi:hypothetical protein
MALFSRQSPDREGFCRRLTKGALTSRVRAARWVDRGCVGGRAWSCHTAAHSGRAAQFAGRLVEAGPAGHPRIVLLVHPTAPGNT